jgi:hypothetical protein
MKCELIRILTVRIDTNTYGKYDRYVRINETSSDTVLCRVAATLLSFKERNCFYSVGDPRARAAKDSSV